MLKTIQLLTYIFCIISALFIACTNIVNQKTAIVTIKTGIKQNASKAPAPAEVSTITLSITGSDMTAITEVIPVSTGELTLPVPAGAARTFTVTAATPAISYIGITTQDITADETITISIIMVKQAANVTVDVSGTLPNGATSISLQVTGSDMTTITETIPVSTGQLSLTVPSGDARTFAVTAATAMFSYSGSSAADLEPGQVLNLPISLTKQAASVTIDINDWYSNTAHITFDDYTVTVTGTTISENLTPSAAGVLGPIDIPSGSSHNITVAANINSSDPSAVLAAGGTGSTSTLNTGDTATITVPILITQTKIILPDRENTRIVIIDDIPNASSTWITKSSGDFNPSLSELRPFDIDFDNYGRIYLINNADTAGIHKMIRFSNITATIINEQLILDSQLSGTLIRTLALDRINNQIFFASLSQLYICDDLDCNNISTLDSTGLQSINGIAVDNSGMLYIAASNAIGSPFIFLYDPNDGGSILDQYGTGLITPWDVLTKRSYIYLANYQQDSLTNNKIMQFTYSDGFILESERTADPNYPSDTFYGPHRFVAILNDEISVVDDGHTFSSPFNLDRLVSMDDIDGTNWTTFGSHGSGTNEFDFFEYYFC